MKFDESSLTGYLVKRLETLTEADPGILAEYVVALLKKDKPTKELHKLCTDNLVEFLGHIAKSFVTELFQALEDGSVARPDENSDAIKKSDPLQSTVTGNTVQPKCSSQKEDSLTSSGQRSDSEDKEVSDDDDDRNHKHRRRDIRPNSSDNNVEDIRRPSRKRSKPYDDGPFLESNPRFNETRKEYNTTSERDASSKFERRRGGFAPMVRAPLEFGPRTRVNQTLRTDPGPRFDLSTTICRPPVLGRGRGRSSLPWSHNESRFNPPDTLDFASQMGPQGSRHPNLFMGTGLPSAASTQNAPWGAFGFIPGIPNRILDPLLPLNLQGTFPPAINPPLNLGMPRQRCRDFEEQGFCLRGDMCPMEHGVNRIVVEDVQSLSQFNLPVSIPSSHTVGMQSGTGSLQQVSAPSSVLNNSKTIPSKSSKAGMTDGNLKLNGVPSVSGGGEADVYDPDQPLWKNGCPESSGALSRLTSPKPSWDADTSSHESLRLSDGMESEQLSRNFNSNIAGQSKNTSVRGRIRSVFKSDNGSKTSMALGNEAKDDHEEAAANPRASYQGKGLVVEEAGPKFTAIKPLQRSWKDSGHHGGKAYAKATRTLFVNGIPHQNNRKEALLSHFQKFGEVIDIYIPLNSEKAFVQFSKREDAEAALKAPDAVMGNRFIKLWWANRDRIPDEGQSVSHIKSFQPPGVERTSITSQLSVSDRDNGSMPSAAQKERSAPAAGTMLPVTVQPKIPSTNHPKATPPIKKLDNLELLKEELRKKQELLDQKRDEFRRQLNEYEKQAISSKKGEVVSEQAVKRHKADTTKEVVKATHLSTTCSTVGTSQEAETKIENNSREVLASPSSKIIASPSSKIKTSMEQSPRNINQMSRLPPTLQNRFKLDNRPTSFRVLPPLPEDLANIATLKDHFSSYDVASVLLEEPETHGDDADQGPYRNCSACVNFSTRQSAEKAYLNGKSWQGHNLQFAWLKIFPISRSDCGIQKLPPSLTPMGASNAEVRSVQVIPEPSSTSTGKSTSSIISEVTLTGNREPMDVEETNNAPMFVPEALEQASQSSPIAALCEKSTIKSDNAIAEVNTDNDCAE